MADPIPAPMVQLPAETVEKLRELVQLPHMPEGSEWYEAALAVVDAATPAASPTVRADDVTVRAENVIGEGRKPSCEPITTTPESASTPPTTGTAATEAKGTPANTSPRPCARNDQSANAYEREATPAASVPAADILALADEWAADAASDRDYAASIAGDRRQPYLDTARVCDGHVRAVHRLVAAAEQADKGEAADTPRDEGEHRCKTCGLPDGPDYGDPHECPPGFLTAPAAPVGEPLPEGWHHIPWTSKEDGVGAPETPASGESGPPAPPALCVGCGHDIGLHNEKGCLHGWAGPEGLCRCRLDGSQAPRVPVNDEAEGQLWLIRNSKTGKWFMGSVGGDDGIWAKNIAMSVVYTSSESGPVYGLPEDGEWVRFRAARGEDA